MNNPASVLRLVLFGPPGSGKGTQAHFLCRRYDIGHVSTGELLRDNTRKGTELGKEARDKMEAGELVPDRLVFQMLEDLYNRKGGPRQGFVLDGFPRSLDQAEELSAFLQDRGQDLTRALLMQLDDEIIVERLTLRRTCPECGRSYHLEVNPPQEAGVCDDDGSELIWRADDREDVIRKRLETYHRQTRPVADFYARRGLLCVIDGSRSIEEVSLQMQHILDPLQAG